MQASDIWSCGLMMFEMLAGVHPLWNYKEDDRRKYKQKLTDLKQFNFKNGF